ncbi:MAG: 2-hydroxyacyl-CoA dehydratase, partial [bacterium]|nr:2-hydroxyacyl-CoA dehydratase [bacterium]
ATGKDMAPILEDIIQKLDSRVANGYFHGEKEAPRVMVTGCPVGGDSTKIFKVIEEAGGVVVALDSCTGMKVFMDSTEEDTADPVTAIAERYLRIPCSCMTPNDKRLTQIDAMIDQFKPDVIIDLILHACHSYNIESFKIGEHVKNNYDNISFLKIETDYSDSDVEQIRTRVETVLNIRKDALAMV